jgi:hypothetical protein
MIPNPESLPKPGGTYTQAGLKVRNTCVTAKTPRRKLLNINKYYLRLSALAVKKYF